MPFKWPYHGFSIFPSILCTVFRLTAWITICCTKSGYKLVLQLSVDIVKKTKTKKHKIPNTLHPTKDKFLFSPLQVSLAFENPLVSNHSVLCSASCKGMHTAFWVNIDPAVTAEEGNYLTHFCILPCLGRGRWMCQTWQWWLWAALCKHPGQLPVRLRPWLRARSWQEELWRYSVLLSYWALKALRETLPGWNAAHFLGSVWAAWDPWNPTQKTSVVFLGVMAEPCSSPWLSASLFCRFCC